MGETGIMSLPDGYTPLAPGKIAALVTFLERPIVPEEADSRELFVLPLERWTGKDTAAYQSLFREIGGPWLWFGHLAQPAAELIRLLDDPDYENFALMAPDRPIGILALDFRESEKGPWLSYFGLVPEATGQGLGSRLMREAVRRTAERGGERLRVHTCSLDDPRALGFYRRAGFAPTARAIEVFDDPRLAGHLPLDCAPQVPLIVPEEA